MLERPSSQKIQILNRIETLEDFETLSKPPVNQHLMI